MANDLPSLPFVSMLTDEEISQAICNFAAKKQMGIDPDAYHLDFRVSYRQVKGSLVASIAILNANPVAKPVSQPDGKNE